MNISKSSRARGSNRGGVGGGYERTDPDYDDKRVYRLKADYLAMEPRWRETFMKGLPKADKAALNRALNGTDAR